MKQERDARGWSTTTLADIAREIARREGSSLKLTQQSVSGFEQPGKKRMPEWIRYIAMAFEEGAPPDSQNVFARDELVYIRKADIRLAMGPGTDLDEHADVELVPFNLNFIQSLSRAPVERLFLATGYGESMEPTLLRHDIVLIDTTDRNFVGGDLIWALTYAGQGYIKRLRRVRRAGADRIILLSDNPQVPPEEAEPEDVHIIGKVVWVGRRMI